MAILPGASDDAVAAKIWGTYEQQNSVSEPRGHLGASQIGDPCARKLWYGFRWAAKSKWSGRMLRLFETGKYEEPRVIRDLCNIGCTVHERDEKTGRQFGFSVLGGHFAGSLDGAILGVPQAEKTWHVLEIKTHSAKSFTGLRSGGVQVAKPMHLAQMQWDGAGVVRGGEQRHRRPVL